MDQSYLERNAAGLTRLRAIVEQLSDEELAQELDEGWTIGAVFAHLAFWDRYLAARWTYAVNNNLRIPESMPHYVPSLINEAALEGWRACPPRLAAQQAVAAAENIERIIAGLGVERVAEVVTTGHPSFIDRTHHWFHHLDQTNEVLQVPPIIRG
jgi:hypothetical protein